MKIAISSSGKTLDSPLDPRFGRCAWFLVIDPADMLMRFLITKAPLKAAEPPSRQHNSRQIRMWLR